MERYTSGKVVKNGQVIDESLFQIESNKGDDYVYDVIRVIDGNPLFAEDHYNRLVRSLQGVGKKPVFSLEEMNRLICLLLQSNNVRNDNVKIIIPSSNGEDDVYLKLMNAVYPDPGAYENGVDTEFYMAVRINPHIKRRNLALREATNKIIEKDNVFEVILTDTDGNITEGSRSNIFFIRGEEVYTCSEAGVLQGVTRKKIVDICRDNGIKVEECTIPESSVNSFDAGFISGTSPKVLPIRRIGEVELDVHNSLLRRIMKLYDEQVEKSCASWTTETENHK